MGHRIHSFFYLSIMKEKVSNWKIDMEIGLIAKSGLLGLCWSALAPMQAVTSLIRLQPQRFLSGFSEYRLKSVHDCFSVEWRGRATRALWMKLIHLVLTQSSVYLLHKEVKSLQGFVIYGGILAISAILSHPWRTMHIILVSDLNQGYPPTISAVANIVWSRETAKWQKEAKKTLRTYHGQLTLKRPSFIRFVLRGLCVGMKDAVELLLVPALLLHPWLWKSALDWIISSPRLPHFVRRFVQLVRRCEKPIRIIVVICIAILYQNRTTGVEQKMVEASFYTAGDLPILGRVGAEDLIVPNGSTAVLIMDALPMVCTILFT